jgi:hypothetical protein
MELCSVSGDVLIKHAEPAEADDVGALVERGNEACVATWLSSD